MKDIYQPTPFMTSDSWVIDGEVVYMEIPIDWGKITGGKE